MAVLAEGCCVAISAEPRGTILVQRRPAAGASVAAARKRALSAVTGSRGKARCRGSATEARCAAKTGAAAEVRCASDARAAPEMCAAAATEVCTTAATKMCAAAAAAFLAPRKPRPSQRRSESTHHRFSASTWHPRVAPRKAYECTLSERLNNLCMTPKFP
jgi:hypothetical protein